jgi:hypothetical protein
LPFGWFEELLGGGAGRTAAQLNLVTALLKAQPGRQLIEQVEEIPADFQFQPLAEGRRLGK